MSDIEVEDMCKYRTKHSSSLVYALLTGTKIDNYDDFASIMNAFASTPSLLKYKRSLQILLNNFHKSYILEFDMQHNTPFSLCVKYLYKIIQ